MKITPSSHASFYGTLCVSLRSDLYIRATTLNMFLTRARNARFMLVQYSSPSPPILKERANVPIFTLSRYITILFFLNNVTEGGETAFPVADREELFVGKNYSTNLSRNCNRGSLVVKPVKGSALLWYNNVLDEESGKMGEVDMLTLHGGCDVIEGEKWIANLWLNAPRGDQTV